MRTAWLLLLALTAVLALGCSKLSLPTEQAMADVFAPRKSIRLKEPPPPPGVPLLETRELDNWRALCNQCHVGPHYSSFTILNWGHRDSCLKGMTCHNCHAKELHRPDVRGDKAKCIECHLNEHVSIDCKTCHSADWRDKHDPHPKPVGQTHVMGPDWKEIQCLKCHGSDRWCSDCHGLPMPHPKDIIKKHYELVKGNPEVCANCHGSQACIRCHRQAGVKIPKGKEGGIAQP